jgi:hypothetical protein
MTYANDGAGADRIACGSGGGKTKICSQELFQAAADGLLVVNVSSMRFG